MTNILFVSPQDNTTHDNDGYPRLGLLLLGTLLKYEGHNVRIVHMVADKITSESQFREVLRDFNPEIVGFTATTYQVKWTRILSKVVKEYDKRVRVIMGGPHVSALKEEVLEHLPNIDQIVVGEGEPVLQEIIEGKTLERGKITKSLDDLPFPDLSLVDIKRFSGPYPIGKTPTMYIMGSRGCPNNCIFCFKYDYSRSVRYHSTNYVLDLIEYYKKDFGIKEIYFLDDTLNLNKTWLVGLLEGIITRGLNNSISFRGAFRANEKLVTPEILKLTRRANFWNIFYGVESGNQEMLNNMQKGITIEEIKRAYKLTHKAGITTEAPFILGLPGETNETIKDSIKLAKELNAFMIGFARAQPFPGTKFREEVKARGYLVPGSYEDFSYMRTAVRTKELTAEELEKWAQYCDKLMLINMIKQCILHPKLLPRTIKAVGLAEVIRKTYKNIRGKEK